MRLLFFIGQMDTGGAQRQISQLADGLARRGHEIVVVAVYPGGQNWDWLQKQGTTKLLSLFDKKPNWKYIIAWHLSLAIMRLRHIIKRERISLVYSALYLSNFIAWLAVRGLHRVYLMMGIRASNLGFNWKRAIPFHICRLVSFSVPLLIYNSYSGLKYHKNKGFRPQNYIVIPNGIDINRFNYNKAGRIRVRQDWGVGHHEKLIGLIGRLDPIKDHQTFLRAAAKVAKKRQDIKFVCVGNGPSSYLNELSRLSQDLGLADKLIWAGERVDMPDVYSSLDIVTSSSYSEGFPNCIGEAMACCVPCVVTNVGDSARIVGETGIVIPPKKPDQLAESWQQLVDLSVKQRTDLGKKACSRIEHYYSIDSMVLTTEKVIFQLLNNKFDR